VCGVRRRGPGRGHCGPERDRCRYDEFLAQRDHAFGREEIGFNFIDNPPRQGRNAAPLMGDQFAFSSELLTKSGKHAGFIDATCMVTRGGQRGAGTCYGTFLLKGGQLAGIAAINFASEGVDHIAIVGGTGVYEGVTGSIASHSRGDNSPFTDDTVHLTFP
jgi:hypothetical protein